MITVGVFWGFLFFRTFCNILTGTHFLFLYLNITFFFPLFFYWIWLPNSTLCLQILVFHLFCESEALSLLISKFFTVITAGIREAKLKIFPWKEQNEREFILYLFSLYLYCSRQLFASLTPVASELILCSFYST